MGSSRSNGKALLDAVRQLPPDEFDAFVDQALSLRRMACDGMQSRPG
jgi:hypothetical protein